MNLYFAPLEGITTYTYRNAHAEMFGSCDGYFSPFITPTTSEKVGTRSFRDILPENNSTPLTVQLLSNDAAAFLDFCDRIAALGYTKVNLNIGCPSSTVVKKGRGAGLLRDVEALDSFLYEIFEKTKMKISIKTRIGFWSGSEFEQIMSVYNKYPIDLLIVHPRSREDYYNGLPDLMAFEKAYYVATSPLCYNGNIFSAGDFADITRHRPDLDSVMLGRGAVKNPAIFREIRGGERLKTIELVDFTHLLAERYLPLLGSEVYTLHKLKEIWLYMMWNFPDEKKVLKSIKKSSRLTDLFVAIGGLPEII